MVEGKQKPFKSLAPDPAHKYLCSNPTAEKLGDKIPLGLHWV